MVDGRVPHGAGHRAGSSGGPEVTGPAGAPPWRLLGPVRLVVDGSEVDLGPPKQRCVLAVLLMSAGRSVPVDDIVSRVWGERPPRAANAVAPYVARLRTAIGTAGVPVGAVVHVAGGYRITCDPDLVDVHRARRLAREARSADAERAAGLYREALTGWHAEALAGLPGEWAARMRETLRRERTDLLADRAESLLRLGGNTAPAEVIEELRPAVAEEPVAERLVAALMTALARTGQVTAALDCYATLRAAVAERFGSEPSARVRDLHLRLLRGQTVGGPAAPAARPAPGGRPARVVPAQLPIDVSGFIGREAELARLDGLPAGHTGARVAVIHGTAGVGKTALAVHWAHRVADRYPDGQLYVNLRGFQPEGTAMPPADALRGFLEALGTPAHRTPADLEALAGLYRDRIAGRRMLVVLDNARDAEQVRPLLPDSPSVSVVVTSRGRLDPLVATAGAHPVALDLLSTAEATQLLARRLGADRVTAEPDAAEALTAACARLPLALAVAAARAQETGFALASLAAELRDAGQRLDALDAGDPSCRLRAVFDSSYTATTPPAAELFRLLGLHPGPDIALPAAASLAGRPVPETRRLLSELTRATLLIEHAPDRYTFHDLLRAYAADLVRADDDGHRRAALTRLLDHYVHTAYAATRVLDPHRAPIRLPIAERSVGTCVPPLTGHDAAMTWLADERPVLLAVLRTADAAAFDTHAWQLAWALDTFLNRRGHWQDRTSTWRIGLRAAERIGDVDARAHAHRLLAHSHTLTDRHADAQAHYEHALDLYGHVGDEAGQAYTHRNLGTLAVRRGRPEEGVRHAKLALGLFENLGDAHGQALCLNAIGWYHVLLGEPEQALVHCRQSLLLHRKLGDRVGEANAWDSLGHAHHRAGRYPEAIDDYGRSLALIRALGDRHEEASTLSRLGDTHHAAGDPEAARAAWHEALAILTDVGHPDAERVRAKLTGPAVPVPS